MAGVADMVVEKILRDLDMDAGAVAGLAVSVNGAAMPHRLERGDAKLHHLAARFTVESDDETDAAGVTFLGRIVEAFRCESRALAPPSVDELAAALGHPSDLGKKFLSRNESMLNGHSGGRSAVGTFISCAAASRA